MLELFKQGCIAMCIGMGVVLTFLCILIMAMIIMSKIVRYLNKIFPEQSANQQKAKKSKSVDDEQIAAAIAAVMAKI